MSKKTKQEQTSDSGDYESDAGEQQTMQYLLNSPAYMSSVMRRQLLQEMFKKLPKSAQGRVNALKNIQLEHIELEAKFYEEVYTLEKKYQALYQPLQDKRGKILTGDYQPTAVETTPRPGTVSEDVDESDITTKLNEVSLEIRKHLKVVYTEDVKGVPDFWLTIFRSTDLLSTMIQSHDEPALRKLSDIKVVYDNEMSYTLEFHFAENEFFTNKVLTKQYFLKSKVDSTEPFAFEGPEIYRCIGCTVDWTPGKNLTVKTIKKKQKHKARGAVRTVNKTVPADSFFNFFNPPLVSEEDDDDNEDMDTESILSTDYEIGHFLRARIIPKAVLYYTGDMVDDDDDDDFDEEEEEEEEDSDDDDEDNAPAPVRKHGKHGHGGGGGASKENPADCKQQ